MSQVEVETEIAQNKIKKYLQDLAAGRIDAALNDSLLIPYLAKKTQLPVKAGAPLGAVESNAIPFRKGSPGFKQAIEQRVRKFTIGKHARPCVRSREELEQRLLIKIKPFVARMLLCVGDVLLPSHALIVIPVGACQGDAKLPEHGTPVNERILEMVPAEACVRGVRAERHPKTTREADAKFRSQSIACRWLVSHFISPQRTPTAQ